MPINYVGTALAGFQAGQQMRQQMDTRNALSALLQSPDDPNALSQLGRANPQMAMQYRDRQQQAALQQIEASRENILKGAQIIRQLNPQDDAGWQQALQVAGSMGMNLSQVPQHYDPQYVQSIVAIADALAPQTGGAPRYIPFQAGGGVVQVSPDGSTRLVVQPNDGSGMPGAPAGQPLSDADILRLKGGQPAQPAGNF